MISTANLRVVEGAGRSTFRPKSLIGVARALMWPSDAIERIASGTDPATLPSTSSDDRPAVVPGVSAGAVELATVRQVVDLQQQLDEQREAIAELSRRLVELGGDDQRPWSSGLLIAASTGESTDADPAGTRAGVRPRVVPFDPDA